MPPRKSTRGVKKSTAQTSPVFAGSTILLAGTGFSKAKTTLSKTLKDAGATVVTRMNKTVTHIIGAPEEAGSARVTKAVSDGVAVVDESYIDACINAGALVPPGKHPLKSPTTTTTTTTTKTTGTKRKATAPAATTAPAAKKAATSASSSSSTASTTTTATSSVQKVVFKKTGKAPVDRKCGYANGNAYVLEDQGVPYDAMLNQTDIRNNNNKFYVIQIIVQNGSHYLWTRWGRVGLDGQNAWQNQGSKASAIAAFEAKFRSKTAHSWQTWVSDPDGFEKVGGKYNPLVMDYGDDDDDDLEDEIKAKLAKKIGSSGKSSAPETPASTLDMRVQDFVKMITDTDAMKQTLVEMNLDVKKMPLGKLSKVQINAGYSVLKDIENALANPGRDARLLEDLSNRFYTLVPHVFGMSVPPIIKTNDLLKQKMDMLEAMGDIEIATSLLKGGTGDINPIDANYLKLNTELIPVEQGSEEWDLVTKFTKNTHGHTHRAYTLEPVTIFKVKRQGEEERFAPFANDHNRRLLWHGSRTTNYMGILSQGLRIAPPEAPATGYMFGKGVYFADMVTKSANYCRVDRNTPDHCGVMILSEVALGDMYKRKHAEFVTKLPGKDLSCFGMGRTAPDPAGNIHLDNGCMVPMGKGGPSGVSGTSLEYNEFIVYDVNQINMKYLIKMKFNSRYGY